MPVTRRIAGLAAALLLVGSAGRVHGQQLTSPAPLLSTAIVRGAAHASRNILEHGGPMLLDSATLGRALPKEAPSTIARAYGRGVKLSSAADAIHCVSGTLRCTMQDHGALVSIYSVVSTADAATVDFTLRWAVESGRRGSTVEKADFEMRLARDSTGWALMSLHQKGES